jgi:hypothetical protein
MKLRPFGGFGGGGVSPGLSYVESGAGVEAVGDFAEKIWGRKPLPEGFSAGACVSGMKGVADSPSSSHE